MATLSLSALVALIGAILEVKGGWDDAFAFGFACIAIEVVGAYVTESRLDEDISLSTEHMAERAEMWVAIVLGESIIALLGNDPLHYTAGRVGLATAGFTVAYLVLKVYSELQPSFHDGHDEHAYSLGARPRAMFQYTSGLATLGFFFMGAGFKFMQRYGEG